MPIAIDFGAKHNQGCCSKKLQHPFSFWSVITIVGRVIRGVGTWLLDGRGNQITGFQTGHECGIPIAVGTYALG
jgi:hypothetical protein